MELDFYALTPGDLGLMSWERRNHPSLAWQGD